MLGVYGVDLRLCCDNPRGKSVYCEYLFSCVFSHLQPICNREAASNGHRRSLGKGPRATALSKTLARFQGQLDEERRLSRVFGERCGILRLGDSERASVQPLPGRNRSRLDVRGGAAFPVCTTPEHDLIGCLSGLPKPS